MGHYVLDVGEMIVDSNNLQQFERKVYIFTLKFELHKWHKSVQD